MPNRARYLACDRKEARMIHDAAVCRLLSILSKGPSHPPGTMEEILELDRIISDAKRVMKGEEISDN